MRWRLKLPNRNHLNLYAKNHYSLVLVESGPKAFYRSLFEPFNISVIAQYVVTFKYLQIDQCNVYMLKMSNKLNLAPGLTLHLLSMFLSDLRAVWIRWLWQLWKISQTKEQQRKYPYLYKCKLWWVITNNSSIQVYKPLFFNHWSLSINVSLLTCWRLGEIASPKPYRHLNFMVGLSLVQNFFIHASLMES